MTETFQCRSFKGSFKPPKDGTVPQRCYYCEIKYQREVGAARQKVAGFENARRRADMDAETATRRSQLLSFDINAAQAELDALLLAGADPATHA